MDDKRFDDLARSLGNGTSRRSILKGLLGLGSAAVTGTVVSDEADARAQGTRPTIPPPPPPTVTTTTTPAPTTTTADPCTGFHCGLDCCDTEIQCCDGECCPEETVCLARVFGEGPFIEEEVCCPIAQTCDEQCCLGECYVPDGPPIVVNAIPIPPAALERECCPAPMEVCQGSFNAECCDLANTECCVDSAGIALCIPIGGCCRDDQCDLGTCDVCDETTFRCIDNDLLCPPGCNCDQGACICPTTTTTTTPCPPIADADCGVAPASCPCLVSGEAGHCCDGTCLVGNCCVDTDCEAAVTGQINCLICQPLVFPDGEEQRFCFERDNNTEGDPPCPNDGTCCNGFCTQGFCDEVDCAVAGAACTARGCCEGLSCNHETLVCEASCDPACPRCMACAGGQCVPDCRTGGFCCTEAEPDPCTRVICLADGSCRLNPEALCCRDDDECGECERCDEGNCAFDCTRGESCCVAGEICCDGLCSAPQFCECQSDAECGDCEVCDGGACEPDCRAGDACCEQGEVCCGVFCEQPDACECLADADCDVCEVCAAVGSSPFCQFDCRLDPEACCPPGLICCQQRCVTPEQCLTSSDTTTTPPPMGLIAAETCVPLSCVELGIPCGTGVDNCGNPIDCGECCAPRDFCTDSECGPVDDGCGGTLDCGECVTTTPVPVTTAAPACVPTTCEQVGCGNYANNCSDGEVYCGDCCTPTSCDQAGCGAYANDCVNGEIYCGDCPTTTAPVTCTAEGDRCVNDSQCCAGLCRGRDCRDRGTKICQAACTA